MIRKIGLHSSSGNGTFNTSKLQKTLVDKLKTSVVKTMDQKQSRRRAWKDKLRTLGRRSKSIPTSRKDIPTTRKFEIILDLEHVLC